MKCPHNCLMEHTSVDLDNVPNPKVAPRIVPRMVECAHWRISSSKKGQHVIFCINIAFKGQDDIAAILIGTRLFNDDDSNRLFYDIWRYLQTGELKYPRGALFDFKNGKSSGKWRKLAYGH